MITLRPYQLEVARAVIDSVMGHKGITFSVEIARQGGKNELSAQLEVLLLTLFIERGGNSIKCSPTFKPQTVISMMRLKDRLNDWGYGGIWRSELGYMVCLGNARQIFLSADESSNVVGNTAHILLEVDEAQDVSREKYTKEFKPMGASTNVTTVLYGTTWDDATLLEEVKQLNLELERKDGIRRHFRYDWLEVAKYNPDYLRYVEGERARLGENHPLFLTQYCLQPIRGGGGLLSPAQRAQLQGTHSRRHQPEFSRIYVAGIDLAGVAEQNEEETLQSLRPGQDSTVITIAELDYSACTDLIPMPLINIVEHCCWAGKPHAEQYPRLVDMLRNVWHVRRAVVDATGVGAGVASFLASALGKSVVVPFQFTQTSKSRLGFDLLTAINAGRVKMYAQDGSDECREFWHQVTQARSQYRANQTMNFYVDPAMGHDDYLSSLALLVEAAKYTPRAAKGHLRVSDV
jgi:hypothetical protein